MTRKPTAQINTSGPIVDSECHKCFRKISAVELS